MHPQLQRALDPVLRDLRAGGGPLPRVADDDWADDRDASSAMLWDDGSGSGVRVDLRDTVEDQVRQVAGQVHDWAVAALRGTDRTNWPPCPRHPRTHPLEVGGGPGSWPWWTCPRDGTPFHRVGELA